MAKIRLSNPTEYGQGQPLCEASLLETLGELQAEIDALRGLLQVPDAEEMNEAQDTDASISTNMRYVTMIVRRQKWIVVGCKEEVALLRRRLGLDSDD